jgi:hypothetical protein
MQSLDYIIVVLLLLLFCCDPIHHHTVMHQKKQQEQQHQQQSARARMTTEFMARRTGPWPLMVLLFCAYVEVQLLFPKPTTTEPQPVQVLLPTNTTTTTPARPRIVPIHTIMDQLTVVSGYWQIPGQSKHSVDFYNERVMHMLDTLHNWSHQYHTRVVFYHDFDVDMEDVNVYLEDQHPILQKMMWHWRNDTTTGTDTTTTTRFFVPMYKSADALLVREARQLVEQCERQPLNSSSSLGQPKRDKTIKHRQRLNSSEPDSWMRVVSVWLSKLALVKEVLLKDNPALSTSLGNSAQQQYVAWVDGGLDKTLLQFAATVMVDSTRIAFRRSQMLFNQQNVQYRGGIVIGPRDLFLQMIDRFYEKLEVVLHDQEALCFDEEAILTRMYNAEEWFRRQTVAWTESGELYAA